MIVASFVMKQHGLNAVRLLHQAGIQQDVFLCNEAMHESDSYNEEIVSYCREFEVQCKFWVPGQDLEPEKYHVLFAVKWRFLFPTSFLNGAKFGAFAIHDSLLPKYRGASPLNWSIINGERVIGATLFRATERVDAGDILEQVSVDFGVNELFNSAQEKMITTYAHLTKLFIERIKCSNFSGTPQIENDASYCCRRTPRDGFINWTKSAVEIYNLYRALSHPAPGVFARLRETVVQLCELKLVEPAINYVGNVPGRVVARGVGGNGVTVLCGEGQIVINSIKIDGTTYPATTIIKSISDTLE